MSDIRRHLTKDEQKYLFKFYMIQSNVDAIISEIHTDFVRSFPRKRKEQLWSGLKKQAETLREAAGDLAEALREREENAKSQGANKYVNSPSFNLEGAFVLHGVGDAWSGFHEVSLAVMYH